MTNRQVLDEAFKKLAIDLDAFCVVPLTMLQTLGEKELLQEEEEAFVPEIFEKFHNTVRGIVSGYLIMADLAAAVSVVADLVGEGKVVPPTAEQLQDLVLVGGRQPLRELKEKFLMVEAIINSQIMVEEEKPN